MTSAVIDASVGLSWVHPDQATPETEALLRDLDADATIVVPMLWFIEVANGLLVLQRRKRIAAEGRKKALLDIAALRLTIDEQPIRTSFQEASDLAEQFGLTTYDATYLEIALRRKIPLATRDGQLRKAASQCGASLL